MSVTISQKLPKRLASTFFLIAEKINYKESVIREGKTSGRRQDCTCVQIFQNKKELDKGASSGRQQTVDGCGGLGSPEANSELKSKG